MATADQVSHHLHELSIEEKRALAHHVDEHVQMNHRAQLLAELMHGLFDVRERSALGVDVLVGYLAEFHTLAPAQHRCRLFRGESDATA